MARVEVIGPRGPVRAVCLLVHGRGQVPADMVRMVVDHVPLAGVRWVMPVEEERLLNALARLHAAEESSLGEGTRFVGMFRASGLVAPVWDLPLGFGAEACEEPALAFVSRLDAALLATEPLTSAERHARAGLTTRQVTLR